MHQVNSQPTPTIQNALELYLNALNQGKSSRNSLFWMTQKPSISNLLSSLGQYLKCEISLDDIQKCIYSAVCSENTPIVNLLLNHGINPNTTNKNGDTLLHEAAFIGNEAIVALLLLQKQANINVQNNGGQIPLHFSIHKNHNRITELLLKNGASIALATKAGHTALTIALENNNLATMSLLLKYLNPENRHKLIDLFYIAYERGLHHMTQLLLQSDHLNLTSPHAELLLQKEIINIHLLHALNVYSCMLLNHNPFHSTANKQEFLTQYFNHMKLMLNKGADINVPSQFFYLHNAIATKHSSLVQLFLDHHANVNVKNSHGNTALHEAACGPKSIVKAIIKKDSSSINSINNMGLTPLHLAITSVTDSNAIIPYLIKKGADTTILTPEGKTVFDIAITHDNIFAMNTLLHYENNTNNLTHYLHKAVIRRSSEIAQLLLNHGADICSRDQHDSSVFDKAVLQEDFDMLILLLNNLFLKLILNKTAIRSLQDFLLDLQQKSLPPQKDTENLILQWGLWATIHKQYIEQNIETILKQARPQQLSAHFLAQLFVFHILKKHLFKYDEQG